MIGQNQASHPLLAILSDCYAGLLGRSVTCYSPVRHSPPKWCVRLACLKHAASVHPEPGSNSPKVVDLKSRSVERLGDLSECWPSTSRLRLFEVEPRTFFARKEPGSLEASRVSSGFGRTVLALNCQGSALSVVGSQGTPANEAKGMVSPHFEAVKRNQITSRTLSRTGWN
jgi:hypothetical protein